MRAPHGVRVGDDVEAGDRRRALGRHGERGEDADGGGLARAVVAEQPEDRAGGDVEIEVAQRPEVAEALAESRRRERHRVAAAARWPVESDRGLVRMLYRCFVHSTTNLAVHCTNGKATVKWSRQTPISSSDSAKRIRDLVVDKLAEKAAKQDRSTAKKERIQGRSASSC